MLYLVSGIKFLYLYVNLILVPVPLFPIHPFLYPLLPVFLHHSAHPLLPLSFTAGLNLPFSQIRPPVVSLFLLDCLQRLLRGPFLLSYSFFFSFSIFFVSVPCTRLSWPGHCVSFGAHVNIPFHIVSYCLLQCGAMRPLVNLL